MLDSRDEENDENYEAGEWLRNQKLVCGVEDEDGEDDGGDDEDGYELTLSSFELDDKSDESFFSVAIPKVYWLLVISSSNAESADGFIRDPEKTEKSGQSMMQMADNFNADGS